MIRLGCLTAALVASLGCLSAPARAASTLERIRTGGNVACGVVADIADYTKLDTHGGLDELGSEFCKAVAAAVLGEKAQAKITNFPDEQTAFKALVAGKVDVLANVSPTATNGTVYNATFGPAIFIDGQGFLVRKGLGIAALRDLTGKRVCFLDNTLAEPRLMVTFEAQGIKALPHQWSETGEMDAGLTTGHCDAMTGDISWLAEQRSAFHNRRVDFDLLPQTITIDPVVPATRRDEPQWAAVVAATVSALLQAEASGLTQANVGTLEASEDPDVRGLIGADHAAARQLGLPDDWAANAIATVGNYGEVYARTVGPGTEMNLPRGANALWKDGGLLYPSPLR
jgi:general L-amino acid transport system substrate-binding protein